MWVIYMCQHLFWELFISLYLYFNWAEMSTAVPDVTTQHFTSKFVPTFKPQDCFFFFVLFTLSWNADWKRFLFLNLKWITVLFKLLHFGVASNDLWERIVTNISQNVGESDGSPCSELAVWVGGCFDQQPSFILETRNWKERWAPVWIPNKADSSQVRWKRDLIRFYSRWSKASWSRCEMWVYLHAERNRKSHWLIPSRGHPGPSTPERRDGEKLQ